MAIDMALSGVPVTINGVRVGKAKVSMTDGFFIEFDDGQIQARRIVKMIAEGKADGISIDANCVQSDGSPFRPTLD
jgi:hypothetical protein